MIHFQLLISSSESTFVGKIISSVHLQLFGFQLRLEHLLRIIVMSKLRSFRYVA